MPGPSSVILEVSLQQMPSGKWVGSIRRDEFGLRRPLETRALAVGWVLERVGEELREEAGAA